MGTGDSFGMAVAHAVASGMGGLRTLETWWSAADDPRHEAQAGEGHVAQRLGVSPADLSDNVAMHELRGELRLGRVLKLETTYPHDPSPQEAKANIRALLGL